MEVNALNLDSQRQYELIAKAIRYIRANVRQQPTLTDVAASVCLSETYLQRLFSQWAGISPKRFLQYLSKEHAKALLYQSRDVYQTALDLGLSSASRLHDLMVSCEAMSPGEFKSRAKGMEIRYGSIDTPFSKATLAWTQRGICSLCFGENLQEQVTELRQRWPDALLLRDQDGALVIAARIFTPQRRQAKLHLMLKGTNFQIKVWEALMSTQPSQLISYSQLADMAGSPQAQRAVGSALAANSIAYLIPCHRVIRENGDLGDAFRWGTTRKLAMQIWEQGQH